MLCTEDIITTPPTMQGDHGQAWLVDLEQWRKEVNTDPQDDAGVAVWVVEAPWAHPAWHSYRISLIHLRPMPDNRETKMYQEDATHEIWVEALDPDAPRQKGIDGGGFRVLTPMNFASQFKEPGGDSQAAARVAFCIRMITQGRLSPDSDFRTSWVTRFGSNMMKL